jgi:hypothetical protein
MSCKAISTSKFIVQSNVQGLHGAGMTIYRNGKRIPMAYKITDSDGKLIESKGMNYG